VCNILHVQNAAAFPGCNSVYTLLTTGAYLSLLSYDRNGIYKKNSQVMLLNGTRMCLYAWYSGCEHRYTYTPRGRASTLLPVYYCQLTSAHQVARYGQKLFYHFYFPPLPLSGSEPCLRGSQHQRHIRVGYVLPLGMCLCAMWYTCCSLSSVANCSATQKMAAVKGGTW
jgi:hypothetical protein